MSKATWHKVTYDSEYDGWVVHIDGKKYGLHCGECMELRIGGRGIPCRLELDRDWYVVMREAAFNLRKKETYQIQFV
jgi:hypothetical protein